MDKCSNQNSESSALITYKKMERWIKLNNGKQKMWQ